DRIRIVRPGAGIDDHRVRPVERVVTPIDVLALAVRLPAAHVAVKGGRPLVDLRLELVQRETAVELRVAPSEHVEIDPVEDGDLHGGPSLIRDQSVERATNIGVRELDVPRRSGVAKEDEPALLVTGERRPRALAVNADRMRTEELLHH